RSRIVQALQRLSEVLHGRMVVDIHRTVHFTVTEDSRNDLRMNSVTAKCRCECVPKVVPSTKRDTETLYDRPDISLQCVSRIDWSRPRLRAEHPFAREP